MNTYIYAETQISFKQINYLVLYISTIWEETLDETLIISETRWGCHLSWLLLNTIFETLGEILRNVFSFFFWGCDKTLWQKAMDKYISLFGSQFQVTVQGSHHGGSLRGLGSTVKISQQWMYACSVFFPLLYAPGSLLREWSHPQLRCVNVIKTIPHMLEARDLHDPSRMCPETWIPRHHKYKGKDKIYKGGRYIIHYFYPKYQHLHEISLAT